MKLPTIVFLIAALLLLAACMTPRQVEASAVITDLYQRGILTREQFEALLAALNPSTWVSDVIAIGTGLIGGVGSYAAVNLKRNAARRARGEPVTVPPAPAT